MINIDKARNLLTPSANTVLKEMVEQYEMEILEKAFKEATDNSGMVYEITVKDLLSSQKNDTNGTSKSSSRKSVFFNIGISVSLLYSFIGFAFFLYKEYGRKLDTLDNIGLVICFAGIFCAIFLFIFGNLSKSLKLYRNVSKSSSDNTEMAFIKRWQELEANTRNWLSHNQGESISNISVKEIISILNNKYVNNIEDKTMLNNALKLRNEILHNNLNVSDQELKKYINFLDKLSIKIDNSI